MAVLTEAGSLVGGGGKSAAREAGILGCGGGPRSANLLGLGLDGLRGG